MGEPTGLDVIRSFQRHPEVARGVVQLLDVAIDRARRGQVVMTAQSTETFANPAGSLHGGIATTLLDSAMTCAVITALPGGRSATTLELNVSFLRPGPVDGTRLVADGRLAHLGRSVARAEGRLSTEDGRLLATATAACMLVDREPPAAPDPTTARPPSRGFRWGRPPVDGRIAEELGVIADRRHHEGALGRTA